MKLALNFLKESINEFKKVEWPSKKEAVKLTFVVIFSSLIAGLMISGLDYTFREMLAKFIALS